MEGLTAYTVVVLVLALAIVVSAEQIPHEATLSNNGTTHSTDSYYFFDLFNLLQKMSEMHYHHVWPVSKSFTLYSIFLSFSLLLQQVYPSLTISKISFSKAVWHIYDM